jgi:hypothetical protein
MSRSKTVRSLPGFIALDTYLVLDEEKRGASLQLNDSYFSGQLNVLQALDSDSGFKGRIKTIQQSRGLYNDISIDFEQLSRENLWEASRRFRKLLQQLPEIIALQNTVPETVIVVPEWLRTDGVVKYGARVYFFRDDDAPDPEDILHENIEAILTNDRERFEQYQGRLHGYPDCCIEFFHERTVDSPPEMKSVEPFADSTSDEILGTDPNTSISIDQIFPDFIDSEGYTAFFAKAFYPEPNCEVAQKKGERIRRTLKESYPEQLVKDFFLLNFGVSYLRTQGVLKGSQSHPTPGILGKEHLRFYLPLNSLLSLSRYS